MTTASPVYPGANVVVTVTLAGSAGLNVDGIGLTLPAGSTNPVAGTASTIATKTLWSGGTNMLLIGITTGSPGIITNAVYADGPVLTFSVPIAAGAMVGSTVNLSLTNALAVNPSGTAVALTTPTLTLTVGTNPTCITAINGHITAYLAAPSIGALGQIVTELAAAATTGTCQ